MATHRLSAVFALMICGIAAHAQDCEHLWTPAGIDQGGINALALVQGHDGPLLFVGGYFFEIQGIAVSSVAMWTGEAWSDLRGGFQHPGGAVVNSFAALDDGFGLAVFAGGQFSIAGGVDASNIARWDGQAWSDVGGGITGQPPVWSPMVNCLYVWDDGAGPALYAGGWFDSAGDFAAAGIARWNGTSWSPLAEGIWNGGTPGGVSAMKAWDDGFGEALYCGGWFNRAGDQVVSNLARWDGHNWSDVGGGVGGPDSGISALEVWDDGSGEMLYVGGTFRKAGGQSGFNHIARWDGEAWDSLNGGFVNNDPVDVFCIFENGNGPGLYAGGSFILYKNQKPSYGVSVARWDGAGWVGQGKGPYSGVRAMAGYAIDGVPTLWVGGSFSQLGEQKNQRGLAYHQGGSTEYPADLFRDGVLDQRDFWVFMHAPFDCDASASLDLFDFLCFINAFNAGCP